MKIAIVQNKVFDKIELTLKALDDLLKENDLSNLDFLVLPEMFNTPYEYKYIDKLRVYKDSDTLKYLSFLAKRYNTYVIGGSVPFDEFGRLHNTSFVFNREGEIIHRYDKMHLFEVTYPNGKYFSERRFFNEGNSLGVFQTEYGKMGLMICFDIRFPELSEKLMKEEVKVIFCPAAFNKFTGPIHWQTTFKARAIDNQLFTIGVSPSDNSYGKYEYYGHSIICDPLGKVLDELNGDPNIIIKDINLEEIEKARSIIPIIANKKL